MPRADRLVCRPGNRTKEAKRLLEGVAELEDSCGAFCTLAAALELGLLEALIQTSDLDSVAKLTRVPRPLVGRMLDVLASLDLVVENNQRWSPAPALVPLLEPGVIDLWRADLRSVGLQAMQLFVDACRGHAFGGWQQVTACGIQSQSLLSAASTHFLIITAFGRIAGLMERLERPGAKFLDVGAGAGGAAIALAQAFPRIHIVALEPNRVALRLARKNVRSAGLTDRIQLRCQRVENLTVREMFEAAHVAQAFLSDRALITGLRTVGSALRPGGWLLSTTTSEEGMGLHQAMSRLRNELWGGGARMTGELMRLFADAGYGNVSKLKLQATITLVAGRRSQSSKATN